MSGTTLSGSRRGEIAAVVAGLALVVVVFGPSVRFPFVHWDDALHVADNPLTAHPLAEGWRRLFLTPRLGYPVPVLVLSFALDRLLFGLAAGAFHAENVALHVVNAGLALRLGERLGLSRRAALGAASLFALHPLVVEPVCWVTGRKDVLSAALLLGALVIAATPRVRFARWAEAFAVLLAAMSMLTKPSTIVAPVLLVIVQRVARPELARRALLVPAAILACVSAALGVLGLAGQEGIGAVRPHSFAEAGREAARALAIQLRHLLFPVGLLPRYFRVDGDPPLGSMLLAAGALAVVAVAAVRLAKPRSPVRTGLLFAAVAYLPVSGVVDLNRWFADSYMYLPLVGLSYAAAALAFDHAPARGQRARAALWGCMVLALAALSARQARIWSSSSSLWPEVVARYPAVPRAWALQATGYLADGRSPDAERVYVHLHEQFPDYDGAIVNEVYAYDRMGDERADHDVWRRCLELAKEQCVEVFWKRVLESRQAPDPAKRDLFALAFEKGLGTMKKRFRERAEWGRFAEALRGVGLEEDARRAEEEGRGVE